MPFGLVGLALFRYAKCDRQAASACRAVDPRTERITLQCSDAMDGMAWASACGRVDYGEACEIPGDPLIADQRRGPGGCHRQSGVRAPRRGPVERAGASPDQQ